MNSHAVASTTRTGAAVLAVLSLVTAVAFAGTKTADGPVLVMKPKNRTGITTTPADEGWSISLDIGGTLSKAGSGGTMTRANKPRRLRRDLMKPVTLTCDGKSNVVKVVFHNDGNRTEKITAELLDGVLSWSYIDPQGNTGLTEPSLIGDRGTFLPSEFLTLIDNATCKFADGTEEPVAKEVSFTFVERKD